MLKRHRAPQPRKGRRAARRALRAGRVVAVCIGASLALGWAAGVALRPYVANHRELVQIRQLQAEIEQTRARCEELRKQARFLNTDKGIEIEGRRAGLVRRGEILLQTSGTPTAPPPTSDGPHPPPLGAVGRGSGDLLQQGLDQASQALGKKQDPPPVAPATASKHPPVPR